MRVVISSGHGKYVRGAVGPSPWGLDEVDEARRVVGEVADWLKLYGQTVEEIHDDVSGNQQDNLHWLVASHNNFPAADRLDVSIHFNAYTPTAGGRGTECLYLTQDALATEVAAAIASISGLINRGAKYRSDLYFLNATTGALGAILVEVCFVDAEADVKAYDQHFEDICKAIAEAIAPPADAKPAPFRAIGKVSWFGGPNDSGVSPSEDLAWWDNLDDALYDAPELFLDYQPVGTTGLARRLDPSTYYIAMRWDYDVFSKAELASGELMFLVRSRDTGKQFEARPADWGPHVDTARVADISPGLMEALEIETDDEVEIMLIPKRAAEA